MTDTTPNLASQVGRFVLYEGRLAHVMGSGLEQGTEPRRWVNLRVMPRRAQEWEISDLVGAKAVSQPYVGNGRYVRVPDLWDWPVVQLIEPVPPPPNGKTYTWKWTGEMTIFSRLKYLRDGWKRIEYSPCHQCYPTTREIDGKRRRYDNVHPPTWEQADCGFCHPGGVCNGKGVCETQ